MRPFAGAPRAEDARRTVVSPSPDLGRALSRGEFDEIAAALQASATPPAADLDDVVARLEDPVQRDAVAALQRARWGGGVPADARAALRSAFARAPRWRSSSAQPRDALPPLYPRRP